MRAFSHGDRVRHVDGELGTVISDELVDYEPLYRVQWDDGSTADVWSNDLRIVT